MSELVSIITPAYNAASYIGEAIDSVLAQEYDSWEMLVIDDASEDDTSRIVASYADDRIVCHRMERRSGIAACRNQALRMAKGRWMAFLDADDKWMSDKLSRQISFMQQRNCHFSYTGYYECEETLDAVRYYVDGPGRINRLSMYLFCWQGCLTVMYDRAVVGLVQIEELEKNNDYAMWLQVIRKSDCLLLDKPLACYRRHEGSITYRPFWQMIVWHYRLFRQADKRGRVSSFLLTLLNMAGGVTKKLIYRSQAKS